MGKGWVLDRYWTLGGTNVIIHVRFNFVKSFKKITKNLTTSSYKAIIEIMAILPTIDKSQNKRELTEKQQSFLDHLVDCQGDAKQAAELAGYKSHYHHVVKTLKSEILELTQDILANAAPKAAFKLVEIMDSKKPIIQANNKLSAAQTLLDRVGVSKVDKLDVTHNMNSGGIFLMPDKAPLDIEEGDYEEINEDISDWDWSIRDNLCRT